MRGRPGSVRGLEELGRVRLSASFFMRDFLHSEIADFHRIPNIPDAPDLAIAAGRKLCEQLLEPLQATFGRLAIRSAYRAPAVNEFGNRHGLSCASNLRNYSRHIWDRRDAEGAMGRWRPLSCLGLPTATMTVLIGAHLPGGSMTTCLTASCSSTPNWPPSTLVGMSGRGVGSTALSPQRAA